MRVTNTTNRTKRRIGRTLLYGGSIIAWFYIGYLDSISRPPRQEIWDGASYVPAGEYTMIFLFGGFIGAMIIPLIGIIFDKECGLKFFRSKWMHKN